MATQLQTTLKERIKNYITTMTMAASCNLILGAATVTVFITDTDDTSLLMPWYRIYNVIQGMLSIVLGSLGLLSVFAKKSIRITATRRCVCFYFIYINSIIQFGVNVVCLTESFAWHNYVIVKLFITLMMIMMILSSMYMIINYNYKLVCQEPTMDPTTWIPTSVKEDKEKQSGTDDDRFTPSKVIQTDTAAKKEELPPSYSEVFSNVKLSV